MLIWGRKTLWRWVVGTMRMLEAAGLNGVRNFVQISTDKAVDPAEGAAKRLGT